MSDEVIRRVFKGLTIAYGLLGAIGIVAWWFF